MDRRKFVRAGAATLAALAIPKLARGQACTDLTSRDNYGKGPFYTPNAPQRLMIANALEPGQKIAVSGTVSNCSGPVANATLDLWHATASGCYKHPNDNCPDIPGQTDQFRLRGKVVTDAQGKYAFESIEPGAYLNGRVYRPKHIHVIITHSTIEQIITQLYFQGDPFIPGDFGADNSNATNRIIPMVKTTPSLWQGTWNVRISGITTGLNPFSDPAAGDFDVVVRRQGALYLIHIPARTSGQDVEVRLFGPDGTLVRRSLSGEGPVQVEMTFLSRGAYLADLLWWTAKGLHTESVTLRK
ncbi:MAG: hypothetical protein M3Y08_09565 [Fibrobacterota bacterium]|nr:hypothetical protein [Fibrobacterota bacterium]